MSTVQPTQSPLPPPPPAPPAPAPKKRSKTLIGIVACGALLLLMVIIGTLVPKSDKEDVTASSPSTEAPAAAAPSSTAAPTTVAPTTTAAPESGISQANPAPIGTTVSPAKNWTVTVTGPADLDAPIPSGLSGMGKNLVAIPVAITNDSTQPKMIMGEVKFSLLSPSGVSITTESIWTYSATDRIDMFAQLQPGATAKGNLYYDATETTGAVLLAEPTMTLDVKKDQRFLAIQ